MPSGRERLSEERAAAFRIKRDGPAGPGSLLSSESAVLVEEAAIPSRMNVASRQEWQLALRVAASKGLCKSELLPKFLLYVCEQQLLGNAHEITEQRIGTQIFNRATNYNPGEDNIVRSYARLLRKRLDEYFEGEGRDESMRIVIPRGGYVPSFQLEPTARKSATKAVQQLVAEEPEFTIPSAPDMVSSPQTEDARIVPRVRWRPAWLSVLLGLVLGSVFTSVGWLGVSSTQAPRGRGPSHAIWAQMFQRNRNTLIVPADSGLGILQNLTHHLIDLKEYASGSYFMDMKPIPGLSIESLNDLREQRYTSVVALNITEMLTRLPEFIESRSQIRYARSITAEDLKSSNAILLGSTHSNPWVSLFENELNFKLQYTPEVNQSFVLNEHPTGTEQKLYHNSTDASVNRTYGAIDYLPSLDGVGHVLIIQGLNMAATRAAADTLFNEKTMKPILQQASLPNGSLKSFELLIETSSIGATAPGSRIIATRFYPQ